MHTTALLCVFAFLNARPPLADYGRVRTQDPIWREHGWAAFQAWEKHCRIETGGYVRASSRPARRAASPQPWL